MMKENVIGVVVFDTEQRISSLPKCLVDLGMIQTGTINDVRRTYKKLAKNCHPDADAGELQKGLSTGVGSVSSCSLFCDFLPQVTGRILFTLWASDV